MKDLKLPKTGKALDAFDKAHAAWRDSSDFDGPLYEKREKAAQAVKEAFAAETADRNPRDRAMLVGPRDPWFRGLVQKWRGA